MFTGCSARLRGPRNQNLWSEKGRHPAIALLGIEPEETIVEKDTHTPVFIGKLFIIATTWKQPGCPSTDECMRRF